MSKLRIKDTKTGYTFSDHGDADFHDITTEDWAKDLLTSDMCCFAETQCGLLVLLDECGRYAIPPAGRFEIICDVEIAPKTEPSK